MKKMWIIVTIFAFILLLAGLFLIPAKASPGNTPDKPKQKVQQVPDDNQLFKYTIDTDPEQTKRLAREQYKSYPPLRPERFRRRVKMLWGIDVDNYPENASIWFGLVDYRLSVKHQIVTGFFQFNPDAPETYLPPPQHIYDEFRNYLLYNDPDACKRLEEWRGNLDSDELFCSDILTIIYNSALTVTPQLISYIDKYSKSDFCCLSNILRNIDIPTRVSDIKGDLLRIYIEKQIGKGRRLATKWSDGDGMWLGFDLNLSSYLNLPEISSPYALYTSDPENESTRNPWRSNTKEKGVASHLAFMLQFRKSKIDTTIVKYMLGKLDYEGADAILEFYKPRHEKIRSNIRSNNYYGYSILREFCDNPMREMPTLEKIGTNFQAQLLLPDNASLLLEPFSDSFDIDTVYPDEIFKAYEMGHDNYYFIEIKKPVESPVADEDGYAMIIDRLETVYGYLPKEQVKAYTSRDVSEESRYNDRALSYTGVIQDKDGYVNIRKEPNSQSEIVGRIADKEVFRYWKTESNWYIVETEEGIRGFVYKDRIREIYDEDINLPNEGDEELPEI